MSRKDATQSSSRVSAATEATSPRETTAYEAARLERIRAQQALLLSLGLNSLNQKENQPQSMMSNPSLTDTSLSPIVRKPQLKARLYTASRVLAAQVASVTPRRISKRLRGESANTEILSTDLIIDSKNSAEAPISVPRAETITTIHKSLPTPSLPAPSNCSVPFLLASIHVTVLDLGTIPRYQDTENRADYWSAPGCNYHVYPIGYRAEKDHFGHRWCMRIEEGPTFWVERGDGAPGWSFSGSSPTKPWTDICIKMASRHGKTRISGPLFFGFSDPLTIHLIQSLKGYSAWVDAVQL